MRIWEKYLLILSSLIFYDTFIISYQINLIFWFLWWVCRGMLYALITESMEYASLVQHANLIIQLWLSLRTTACPRLLYQCSMHLSLLIQEGFQLSNQPRHLHRNNQLTSFNNLIQKLLPKIHLNKLTVHQLLAHLRPSLYRNKLLEVLFFFWTFFFSFSEKYIIHTIYSPFWSAILQGWIVCSMVVVTIMSLWGIEGIFFVVNKMQVESLWLSFPLLSLGVNLVHTPTNTEWNSQVCNNSCMNRVSIGYNQSKYQDPLKLKSNQNLHEFF